MAELTASLDKSRVTGLHNLKKLNYFSDRVRGPVLLIDTSDKLGRLVDFIDSKFGPESLQAALVAAESSQQLIRALRADRAETFMPISQVEGDLAATVALRLEQLEQLMILNEKVQERVQTSQDVESISEEKLNAELDKYVYTPAQGAQQGHTYSIFDADDSSRDIAVMGLVSKHDDSLVSYAAQVAESYRSLPATGYDSEKGALKILFTQIISRQRERADLVYEKNEPSDGLRDLLRYSDSDIDRHITMINSGIILEGIRFKSKFQEEASKFQAIVEMGESQLGLVPEGKVRSTRGHWKKVLEILAKIGKEYQRRSDNQLMQ